MLPVSAAYLAAIRSSHQIVSRVRLITPGATGANPPGTDLRVEAGTVTLDGTADIRGTLDLTVMEGWPQGATTADLVPYGTELAVSRGVVFGNGAVERAPLGIYRVGSVEQSDAPGGPLRITAADRMSGIVEGRMLAPAQFLPGEQLTDIVAALVTEIYPDAVIEWDDDTGTTMLTRTQIVEEDRYAFLRDLVRAQGKVMNFDYRGVLVIRSPPDPTVAVFEVNAGAGGVLASVSRSLTREGVYNAVAATGEALDDEPAPYGVAYDYDPASVTWWHGPFGKVPRFYSSPFITSDGQAENAARGILFEGLGLPYSVDFTAVPNSALEPLDVVRVSYPPMLGRARSVVREIHVLDRLAIPLTAEAPLTASTRLQTTGGTG